MLAGQLLADTIAKQHVDRGTLTIHADNGSSMASKPVATGAGHHSAQPTGRDRGDPEPNARLMAQSNPAVIAVCLSGAAERQAGIAPAGQLVRSCGASGMP